MKISDRVLGIRFGAIYRVAVERQLGREIVESLLTDRAGLGVAEAKQLAAHWFTTWHLRQRQVV